MKFKKFNFVNAILLLLTAGCAKSSIEQFDSNFKQEKNIEDDIVWYDVASTPQMRVGGLVFFKNNKVYRRLPVNPPETLPLGVENLAWHTSGGQIRFKTNSPIIKVRIKFRPFKLMAMGLAPQRGIDLYRGKPTKEVYASMAYPTYEEEDGYERIMWNIDNPVDEEYLINMPLYQGIEKIEIGLAPKSKLESPTPWKKEGTIIVYGGSTLQGARASRPGNSWTSITSRNMNLQFANMGFSGSGKTENSVAKSFALIDNPMMFIMCSDSNSTLEMLQERFIGFIKILREKFPTTPILVSPRERWGIDLREGLIKDANRAQERIEKSNYLKEQVEMFKANGDKNIYFMDYGALMSDEDVSLSTADGSHPNDYGFILKSKRMLPIISEILEKGEK